jgi:hypothetical protein
MIGDLARATGTDNNDFEGAIPELTFQPGTVLRIVTLHGNARLHSPNANVPEWIVPTLDYKFYAEFYGCPNFQLRTSPDCMSLSLLVFVSE